VITQQQQDFFTSNGYLLVPGILDQEQVRSLREYLRPKFEAPAEHRPKGDLDNVMLDVFSHNPPIRWLLFHEPTQQVLRGLLGDDYVVLREAGAHFEMFGTWHKDTTAQERAGHTFQWDPDYLMVEVAYYLQDNSEEFGGGVDVQPGTHRQRDRYATPKKADLYRKVRNRVFGDNSLSVPSTAGDLVIFDFRLNHRATQRTSSNPPPDRQKMAVFIACSRNTPHVQRYHDYIASRPDYLYLQGGFSYPEDFAREAEAHGINMP
jgi:ectoine hydroxylase-related dioxygenase (phytanoyl-CoA dioxygenase family)